MGSQTSQRRRIAFLVCGVVAALCAPSGGVTASPHARSLGPVTELVSRDSSGQPGNHFSTAQVVSQTGRFVAFETDAGLVSNDNNSDPDIYLRDRRTSETTLVSQATDGRSGNHISVEPAMTPDGRYIAFASIASNLVTDDTNEVTDVFVWDRLTGTTTLASLGDSGQQGDEASASPALSADGRYLAFASQADNLVPNDTNQRGDVFVRDLTTGTVTRASVSSDGTQGDGDTDLGVSMSADGRYVSFASSADNLVRGDTNGVDDVFVHSLLTGETVRASVRSHGAEGLRPSEESSLSGDGHYLAFSSRSRLVPADHNRTIDVYVRNLVTNRTRLVSVATDGSAAGGDDLSWVEASPSISDSGRYVAFSTRADDIVAGDSGDHRDIFVRDRRDNRTILASVSTSGEQANGDSLSPSLSANGRHVTFSSYGTNLVAGLPDPASETYLRLRYASAGP